MGTSVTKLLIAEDYDPKQTELGFSCHFEKVKPALVNMSAMCRSVLTNLIRTPRSNLILSANPNQHGESGICV